MFQQFRHFKNELQYCIQNIQFMFFCKFSDASHKAARDKEMFDATAIVFHKYPQGSLTKNAMMSHESSVLCVSVQV